MNIGIIGAGNIGGTLARRFVDAGHDVALANSRGPETLTEAVAELGPHARAATIAEAAKGRDFVIVAIPFVASTTLPADAFDGAIVVDTGNYYPQRDGHFEQLDDGSTSSSEILARHLNGATVLKAFNTIYYMRLLNEGRPAGDPDRQAIPIAGDDDAAKHRLAQLIDEIGFDAVDAGSLADGRRQEPGSPVYNVPLTKEALEQALGSTR